jgi:predicted DNA-binding protein (MmcQ/YjbR family)
MSLYTKTGFDAALAWPGVTMEDQWESHIAKVGGKVFCLLSDNAPHRLVFKCGEGVSQAAYFAKRMWVSVREGSPLTDDEQLAYIRRSYALVAKGLTRKLRSELGITDDVMGI